MTLQTVRRYSMTIKNAVARDLDYVADFTGISRSALVSELLDGLAGPLKEACEEAERFGVAPADRPVRMRGSSVELVEARLARLTGLMRRPGSKAGS